MPASKQAPEPTTPEDDVLRRMLSTPPKKGAPARKKHAPTGRPKVDYHNVACPCCSDVLYKMWKQQPTSGNVWLVTEDSPRPQEDDNGWFIQCPHCSQRVAMIPDPLAAHSYQISPEQPCNEKLP